MIISLILSAFLLGIIVAIPPGSVTVIVCQRALQFGFRNSILFSLGSCLSDIFYITIVLLGISNIITGNKTLSVILWLVCGTLLLFFGVSSLLQLRKDRQVPSGTAALQRNPAATFASGILVTLTNPMTIAGWLAIAGNYFLIWDRKYPGFRDHLPLTVLFIMLGVLAWMLPLSYAVSRLGRIMGDKVRRIILAGSAVFLLAFGLLGYFYAVKALS